MIANSFSEKVKQVRRGYEIDIEGFRNTKNDAPKVVSFKNYLSIYLTDTT